MIFGKERKNICFELFTRGLIAGIIKIDDFFYSSGIIVPENCSIAVVDKGMVQFFIEPGEYKYKEIKTLFSSSNINRSSAGQIIQFKTDLHNWEEVLTGINNKKYSDISFKSNLSLKIDRENIKELPNAPFFNNGVVSKNSAQQYIKDMMKNIILKDISDRSLEELFIVGFCNESITKNILDSINSKLYEYSMILKIDSIEIKSYDYLKQIKR